MVMMVVVMMVPMTPDHDHRPAAPMAVMMVMVMVLSELDVRFLGSGRTFIDDLEDLGGIWNRLQQVSVGVGLQRVCGHWGCRRGLRSR